MAFLSLNGLPEFINWQIGAIRTDCFPVKQAIYSRVIHANQALTLTGYY